MIEKYRVHELARLNYSDIGEYIDENHTDRPLRNDILVKLLNNQDKQIKELEEDLNDALNRIEERSIDVQLLKKENENLNNVLEDFMVMLNRLQAEPNNKSLQGMARDMLRMMGKNIMGDSDE